MKKVILFFAVWVTVNLSFAQSKKDTTKKVPKITLEDISKLLPQITPKSPNVASLERYGSIPVSMYTGLPNIEIPIFEIKIGSLTIPIKLSYHASGNKVNDKASWVGLGWSIPQFSVTRNIRGRADEDAGNGGLLGQNLPDLSGYQQNISCLTQQLEFDLNAYTDFGKDIERDIFTYNLPKKSNSFVFVPNGYLWQEYEQSKVSYSGNLNSINLVDEDGYRYDFTTKETTNSYTSAWLLNTIQGTKPTEKAIFTYNANAEINFIAETTDTEIYKTDIGGQNPEYGGSAGLIGTTNTTNQGATIYSHLLNEIFFPNGKIVFVTSPNREDNLGSSLSAIEIYSFNINTNAYSLVKKFTLVQSYKDGRLFLDGVNMVGSDGSTIGTYTFTYNSTTLPDKYSRSKDYCGYYNGQTNATLIPAQSLQFYDYLSNPNTTTYNIGSANPSGIGANRNPNESLMKARILTQINYPTGGFTTFDYEAHRHDNGQVAGGLRIKNIVSNDGNGKTTTKTYKYGTNEDGNGTYRDIWLNIPNKTYSTVQRNRHVSTIPILPEYPDYEYKIRVFSSANTQPMNPNEGSVVTYPVVTEYEDNGSGSNGKIIYTFKDDIGDVLLEIPSASKQFQKSRHWNRGQLLSKVVYGTDSRKKFEQINTYSTIANGTSPVLGYLVGKSIVPLSGYEANNNGCLVFNNESSNTTYTPIRPTEWLQGVVRQIRSEEYTYDDTDDLKFVYKKTETDFDNTYFQPKESRNFNSDGDIRIQKMRYVTDFSTSNGSQTDNALALYQMKQNNEITTPIEVLSLRKNQSDTKARLLGGKLTHFQTFNFNSYSYVLPDNIYLLEISNSPSVFESAFTFANVSGGNVVFDNHYAMRLNFGNYDSYGQLLDFRVVTGSNNTFTYSTTSLDNVFHSFPTSETKNAGGITSYITNFAYDLPLLGIKEMTAPNGLKSYFEYDIFGRFLRAKDHNGNIVKEYQYNYGVGNSFIKEFTPREAMNSLTGNYQNYETIINYLDGLGRPIQSVHLLAGQGASNDIVTGATTYDNYGRVEKSFIPFPNSGNGSEASVPSSVHGDNSPFSKISEYDNSPLNRPKKTLGVGQAWHNNNKFIENKYLIVSAGTIRKYVLTANGADVNGTWNVSLYKNVNVSERGKEVIEYKDNDGKLIQKDVQESEGVYMSTYYIYDEFDRLKYTIQPESFKTATNFTENDGYFQAGVFANKYDKRGRIIESHVPSGGWTYSVYDNLDRVVLNQTEIQRENGANKWNFIKYDAIGRDILKGEITPNTGDRQSLQNDFTGITQAYEEWNNGYTNVSFPSSATVGTNQDREIKIYDHYDYIEAEWAFNTNPNYQAFHAQYANNKGLLSRIIARDPDNVRYYNTVFYYDNKGRIIQTYQTHHLGGSQYWTKPIITNTQYNFVGQITKEQKVYQKNGETPRVREKTYSYDHVGRKQNYHLNIGNINDIMANNEYDAVGRQSRKTYLPNGAFQYGGAKDYIIRPTQDGIVTQNNTNDIARKYIILEPTVGIDAINLNSYSAQIDLNAPQGITINGLQKIDFNWHIRGWLLGLNLDNNLNPIPNATEGDLFAYRLEYDEAGYYDGNIGKETWKSAKNTGGNRSYTFNYDDASRFKSANYVGGMYSNESFSIENVNYDKNGNILTFWRKGMTAQNNGIPTSFDYIDKMQYFYTGNKLLGIDDAVSNNLDVGDLRENSNNNDFTYYNDGSLKSDANRNISLIEWDTFLKKIKQITYSDGRWIKHFYDGSGNRFQTTDSDNTRWDYVNGMIYKTDIFYQINDDIGRILFENGQYSYEFSYKDHLGNTRVAFKAIGNQLTFTQENAYYPFGLSHTGTDFILGVNGNNFLYNGKEKINSFGLNVSDYGFRTHDFLTNRFWSVDGLASDYAHNGVYNYAENRPVSGVDLDGLEYVSVDAIGGTESDYYKYQVNNGTSKTVEHNGQSYLNLGHHLYKNSEGKLSNQPQEGYTKISEWVYTEIAPVIPSTEYVPYSTDCMEACKDQIAVQNLNIGGYDEAIQMSKSGEKGNKINIEAGIDAINSSLEKGNSIIVGVDYNSKVSTNPKTDNTTDHFVTIVGRGEDSKGKFFSFYENATARQSTGTDVSNKFYIQSDGNFKGVSTWHNKTFTGTQVRPTKTKN